MDLGLRGKGVIVTGASNGIGRAIALAFAEEEANVAICARGNDALEKTAAELRAKGVRVHAASCDVGKAAALEAFLESARRALGRVDVLVNNASAIALLIPDEDEAWQASLTVGHDGHCARVAQSYPVDGRTGWRFHRAHFIARGTHAYRLHREAQ
jgi:3-oxoacyl-[acyl-carrier protein] reductase